MHASEAVRSKFIRPTLKRRQLDIFITNSVTASQRSENRSTVKLKLRSLIALTLQNLHLLLFTDNKPNNGVKRHFRSVRSRFTSVMSRDARE